MKKKTKQNILHNANKLPTMYVILLIASIVLGQDLSLDLPPKKKKKTRNLHELNMLRSTACDPLIDMDIPALLIVLLTKSTL